MRERRPGVDVLLAVTLAGVVLTGVALPDALGVYPGRNGRLLIGDDSGVYSLLSDGSGTHRLRTRGPVSGAAWSGDGRQVILGVRSSGQIQRSSLVVMRADGRQRHTIVRPTPHTHGPYGVAWSADNKWIAFVEALPKTTKAALYVARADGTGRRRVFTSSDGPARPRWSPDGRHIAFSQERAGISIIDRDGSGRRVLAPGFARGPDWSPDGKRLVFGAWSLNADGTLVDASIMTVNTDGSRLTAVVHELSLNANASLAWSPDGTEIAYSTLGATWVINSDGTTPRRIHAGPGFLFSLDWQRRR